MHCTVPHISFHSPIGPLTVFERDRAIVALEWGAVPDTVQETSALLRQVRATLDAYFDGTAQAPAFDFPYRPDGTPFQQRVWHILTEIPFGGTLSYGAVAEKLGAPRAVRAVARACGANPVPVLIPCHRVVGGNGGLGGYSGDGGVQTKRRLLALEGVLPGELPL